MISNIPIWNSSVHHRGFQEVWYLKLNDPASSRALWLRFTLLISKNQFRKIAEVWAIFFQRKDGNEIQKIAVKQTHDLSAFSQISEGGTFGSIKIAESTLTDSSTSGAIQSKGQSVKWDFTIKPSRPAQFNLVPGVLANSGIVKNTALTVQEDLRFSGTCEINGERISWQETPGMQGHLAGPRNGHSWVWGHCNAFVDEQGNAAPLIFDGISARALLPGGIPSPKMSTFYFNYRGAEYPINSLWQAVRSRSQNTLTEWTFIAEHLDLTFRGHIRTELRNFAGVTYEDTDGSFLYCANSKLSDMEISVYRAGKCDGRFKARGTAAFEVVTRQKSPYVPLLL